MATPVRGSWGGIIKFTHNFPYQAGDTAVIQYKTSEGDIGELSSLTFDASEITANVPEDFFDTKGYNWTFNMKVSGTRINGDFLIQSEIVTTKLSVGINPVL